MPLINGRFYANPAYGRALERARAAEAESEAKRLGHDYPGDRESGNELLPYDRSHGQRIEHGTLPYNTADKREVEELSQQQAGAKHAPAQQPTHVPNSSYVTDYPHEKKVGGSAGWRNNNPANIMHGSFAKAHGAIGKDHLGRAVFPTMKVGEDAQDALWNSANYQGLTIREAAKTWSGSKNPVEQRNYISALSEAAAAPPSTPVSDLDPDQLERLKEAQKHQEGFSPGIVAPKKPR